jgi:uncharacterized protein (TIGR04206 family)
MRANSRRRLLLVVLLGVTPWTVLSANGFLTVYSAFGWVDVSTLGAAPVTTYLFHAAVLPRDVTAYALGAVTYGLAVLSASLALLDREDPRVTAAMLVLAGAGNAWFALGLSGRPGYVGIPLGSLALWAVVWWQYRTPLERLLLGQRPE